jgi:hypothetical protein
MIKFTEQELYDIFENKSEEWATVAVNNKGEERWGYDDGRPAQVRLLVEEIVFTKSDGSFPFYAFTYYVGSGDSEIDFEPSDVYTVFPKEVTVIEWTKINED